MAQRAVVIGGSIGGLFAGLFLRQSGWNVSIHERAGDELGARGAGIVTHDELLDLLTRASGCNDPIGVAVDGRVVLAQDGSVICETKRPQVLASWDRIWQRLRAAADGLYRHGSALTAITTHGDHVTAQVGDAAIDADLVVAADGIQSSVRRLLQPEVAPLYAGYVAWRGLVDEGELSEGTCAQLLGRFGFCLPPREQMLGYPVDGSSIGSRRYNYVWYRPADPVCDLPRLLTAADGTRHANAIPPDRIHPDVLAQMRDDARRLLAPAFAEMVHKTRQPLLQPIVDLEIPTMVHGRIAWMGDAAFVARPHVGMGVTKAAGDAKALADALADSVDIDAALARYNEERLAFGRRIVRRARHLGAYMQAQLLSDDERRQAERHRSPQAVAAETATMAGMDAW